MAFKTSSELVRNGSISWKKIGTDVPVLMGNIIQTGSTDGSGTGGQNPTSFTSQKSTIRFWAGGVEQSNRPITVFGFTDNTQGGFVPQWGEITEQGSNWAVNMHVRFRLAEYQGECGNTSIDGANNCAKIQTLTITGTPTGGTFTLTWNGVTTGAIAYNAAAGTVQTALAGLAGLFGSVTVTGAALPAGTQTITYSNTNNTNVLTSTDSLTGGTSPATALAVTSWVNGANLFSGGYQVYASGTEAARIYIDTTWFWSGNQGSFVSLLPIERTGSKRQQVIKGRIYATRDGSGTDSAALIDYTGPLVSPIAPVATTGAIGAQKTAGAMSATFPQVEKSGWNNPASGNYSLPTIAIAVAGGHEQITVTYSAQQEITSMLAKCWTYAAPSTPANHFFDVWSPVDQNPDVHSFLLNLSIIDFRLITAHVVWGAFAPGSHIPIVFDNLDLYLRDGLFSNNDIVIIDFMGLISPIGEDVTAP